MIESTSFPSDLDLIEFKAGENTVSNNGDYVSINITPPLDDERDKVAKKHRKNKSFEVTPAVLHKFLKKHYKAVGFYEDERKKRKELKEYEKNKRQQDKEHRMKQLSEDTVRKDFLIALAKALHVYGSPTYRTEYTMTYVAQTLGIQGMFAIFPTLLISSFEKFDRDPAKSETHTLSVDQGLNCEKLHDTDELADKIVLKEMGHHEAFAQLKEILARPSSYPWWLKLLCYGLCSGSCAPLYFNGGWTEMIISFFLGLIVGCMSLASYSYPPLAKLLVPVAAILISFMATALSTIFPSICYFGVILSSLIWLLPGLTLTISVMELATRNMISGTSRIFYSFIVLIEFGFGIAIGTRLAFWSSVESISDATDACKNPSLSEYWNFIFFFAVALPFAILLEGHRKQWLPMLAACAVAYLSSLALGRWVFIGSSSTSYLIPALSSFCIGMFGTLYSRYTKRQAVVPILAGIIMLVPGSVGVRGITSVLVSNDVISGINFGFQMMTIALSLTVGLLFAHLLVFPKKVLTPSLV